MNDTSLHVSPSERFPDDYKYQIQLTDLINNLSARELTDEAAKQVTLILNLAELQENTKVSMSRPPDYNLGITRVTDDDSLFLRDLYKIWLNPKGDRLELVNDSKSEYGLLSLEDSTKLLSIITDTNTLR